jgi:uncharacterized protein YndB with AHSA1/START domain
MKIEAEARQSSGRAKRPPLAWHQGRTGDLMSSTSPGGRRVLGSLRSSNGKGVVQMEEHIDAGIDDVWSALTDPQRLAGWLGAIHGDLHVGGAFHARFYASGSEGPGRVDACDPPHRFVVTRSAPLELVIETTLAAQGPQTVLTVEQRGMPLHLLGAYGAGLQIHVEDLVDHVSGRQRRDTESRWDDLIPVYETLAATLEQ